MKTTILGARTGDDYYIDLRQGWRMGDFAGLRLLLEDWRRANPNARVSVSYNTYHWRSVYGSQLNLEWVFEGLVDVLYETESKHDQIPNQPGIPMVGRVFSSHIWNDWGRLRIDVTENGRQLTPRTPPSEDLARARELLDRKGVPENYVTLHPLFDAGYNKYRNGSTIWWNQLIDNMAKLVPVVVIGTAGYTRHIHIPPNAFQTFDYGVPAHISLAMISQAKVHVGGETGLTLWAGVCGVPVLATYGRWISAKDKAGRPADFRPIPVSAPVIYAPLNGPAPEVATVGAAIARGDPAPTAVLDEWLANAARRKEMERIAKKQARVEQRKVIRAESRKRKLEARRQRETRMSERFNNVPPPTSQLPRIDKTPPALSPPPPPPKARKTIKQILEERRQK